MVEMHTVLRDRKAWWQEHWVAGHRASTDREENDEWWY